MVFQQEAPSDMMADHEREIRILQYDRQYITVTYHAV